jgi:predicted nucleotidyltransferase
MGATDGHSKPFAVLEESLCDEGAIEFAVAFGSQVTGDLHPSSDLDLAVKFSTTSPLTTGSKSGVSFRATSSERGPVRR